MITPAVEALIDLALEEDLGRGDVTSAAVLGEGGGSVRGVILARQALVLSGLAVARRVFERVDPAIAFEALCAEGAAVAARAVAEVAGPAAAVLAAERTALNFLMRLSGIATLARRFADAVAGTRARVVDTRKTTPGWRALEKAAVRHGGCANHRADLGSGILVKDNHVAACGGVRAAVERARANAPHSLRVECEVTSRAELDEALAAGADVVLLDNMPLAALAGAVAAAHARGVLVEVSGGVTLDTVRAIAETGADLVSAGAITHSAPAADLSLDLLRS